jgi:hypothetical protein
LRGTQASARVVKLAHRAKDVGEVELDLGISAAAELTGALKRDACSFEPPLAVEQRAERLPASALSGTNCDGSTALSCLGVRPHHTAQGVERYGPAKVEQDSQQQDAHLRQRRRTFA